MPILEQEMKFGVINDFPLMSIITAWFSERMLDDSDGTATDNDSLLPVILLLHYCCCFP